MKATMPDMLKGILALTTPTASERVALIGVVSGKWTQAELLANGYRNAADWVDELIKRCKYADTSGNAQST